MGLGLGLGNRMGNGLCHAGAGGCVLVRYEQWDVDDANDRVSVQSPHCMGCTLADGSA